MQLLFINRETNDTTSEILNAEIRHDIWTQKNIDGECLFENDIVLLGSVVYMVRFITIDDKFYFVSILGDGITRELSPENLEKSLIIGNLWNGVRKDISFNQASS